MSRRVNSFVAWVLAGALISVPGYAAFDFSSDVSGRSYPDGGTLNLKAGYGLLLWGEDPTFGPAGINPWYGYVRPRVSLSAGGTYNEGVVALEVFPVSILGVSAGAKAVHKSTPYTNFNCALRECEGLITSEFVSASLVLGAGSAFFVVLPTWERLRHEKIDGEILEVGAALPAEGAGDNLFSITSIGGISLTDHWTMAVAHLYQQMQMTKSFSRMATVNLSYKSGNWGFLFGLGYFESALKEINPVALGRISWTPLAPISLF